MGNPTLLHQGKVRDVYAWNDDLLLVASDRISAFDVVLPTLIPSKGIMLTQLSRFWFEFFAPSVAHHVISFDLPEELHQPEWRYRTTWCRKAETIPMECVVRGYLFGSAWKDYKTCESLRGMLLPAGLKEAQRLPTPLFTPTTKAKAGHDEPLTQNQASDLVGSEVYGQLQELSISIYRRAHDYALKQGVIIADTKFEFGWIDGKITLIDELLTPDSSRFWPVEEYEPGKNQISFDKQIVRNYLLSLENWNQQPPGPELPLHVVKQTLEKYAEVYKRLTNQQLPVAI